MAEKITIGIDQDETQGDAYTPRRGKRGRPPAEAISTLIVEGSLSHNDLKCSFCARVFPREKSLNAHLRTHTGETPYKCSFPYPKCEKSFKQSGQLKTHERLHTNERCFKCPVQGCNSRFRHANRKCRSHNDEVLIRSPDPDFPSKMLRDSVPEVQEWLLNFLKKQERRNTPRRATDGTAQAKMRCLSHGDISAGNEFDASRGAKCNTSSTLNDECSRLAAPENKSVGHSNIFNSPTVSKVTNNNQENCCIVQPSCSNNYGDIFSYSNNAMHNLNAACSDNHSSNKTNTVMSTPQRNTNILTTINDSDLISTPVRNTYLSTPKNRNYYATPDNSNFSTSVESSYYSTPNESHYGTPLGSTLSNSSYFSTPLGPELHFPCLGNEHLTSTPMAEETSDSPHLRESFLVGSGSGPTRKSLPLHYKRSKSRRGLGPLMEASNTCINSNKTVAVSHTPDSQNIMPLSSPSITSSVTDENAFGQNENTSKNIPSSPQPSRVFRNMQNIIKPKKHEVFRCLDMDGIKPLNSDEPFSTDSYRPSLYNNDKRNQYLSNHSSPSFTRHQFPAKVAMEMTADFFSRPHESSSSHELSTLPESGKSSDMQPPHLPSSPTSQQSHSPLPLQSAMRVPLQIEQHYTSSITSNQNTVCIIIKSTSSVDQEQERSNGILYSTENKTTDGESLLSKQQTPRYKAFKNCDDPHIDQYSSLPTQTYQHTKALSPFSKAVSLTASPRPILISCLSEIKDENINESREYVNEEFSVEIKNEPDTILSNSILVPPRVASELDACLHIDTFDQNSDYFYEDSGMAKLSKPTPFQMTVNDLMHTEYPSTEVVNWHQSQTDGDQARYCLFGNSPSVPEQNLLYEALQSQSTNSSNYLLVTDPVTSASKPTTPVKRPLASIRNYSPRKIFPKKRWMSQVKSQASAAVEGAETLVQLSVVAVNDKLITVSTGEEAEQKNIKFEVVRQQHVGDDEPLNLSTRY